MNPRTGGGRSTRSRTADPSEIRTLCARARAAGAPNGAARPRLVGDYHRLAEVFGVEAQEVRTGHELARASAALLRVASARSGAPTSTPRPAAA